MKAIGKNKIAGKSKKQLLASLPKILVQNQQTEQFLEELKTTDLDEWKLEQHLYILGSPETTILLKRDTYQYIPTIRALHRYPALLKTVTVNQGALKPILNGANIMGPGLVAENSSFPEDMAVGDIVAVIGYDCDGIICATGACMKSAEELRKDSSGLGIELIERVGDSVYNLQCLK